jgi:hypothetical protein
MIVMLPQNNFNLTESNTLQMKETMYTRCIEIYGPIPASSHPPPDKA